MKITKIKDMSGGWFVGDFDPAVLRTKDFEIGYKLHLKGSHWDPHYHKLAVEITYLLRGKMKIGDNILEEGDIFVIDKMEVANPEFLEDCEVVVVKTPSVPGDKYVVGAE